MTVLDAFAVLALLKDEPAAAAVEQLLRGRDRCQLTVLGIAETVDHLVRVVGAEEDDALLDLAGLGLLDALPLETDIATRAGLLRARRYDRRQRPLSMSDCVAAEAARAAQRPLATSDPPLLALCAAESIPYLALPDSRGEVWQP